MTSYRWTSDSHVGWSDAEHFYFLPDILYNKVGSFLSRQGEQIPLKQESLWKQLEEAGCLIPEISTENGKEKTKRRRRKSIDGQRVTTVWIKREFLVEKGDDHPSRESVRRESAASTSAPGGNGNPFDVL
ncbi:hypothetical protein [Cohnella fermenti]|uniref:Uncharacterized protein n=1 Tax=Cohnella fermenti TaxID=2565925 RepID=A0A4S4BK51_9BACL|nr:hypothetical protein [Cohnella fermenti]THF74121.1 hypothetical protein E6C55_26190 [Cohnella fermenti]